MMLMRDHYEGTEFDLTKGIAAGPFGNPTVAMDRMTDRVTLETQIGSCLELGKDQYRYFIAVIPPFVKGKPTFLIQSEEYYGSVWISLPKPYLYLFCRSSIPSSIFLSGRYCTI